MPVIAATPDRLLSEFVSRGADSHLSRLHPVMLDVLIQPGIALSVTTVNAHPRGDPAPERRVEHPEASS